MADYVALAGLLGLGLAEIGQTMSQWLPSPTTAMLDGNPERLASLRFDMKLGAGMAIGIAAGVALVASRDIGKQAWWVFLGSLLILGVFIWRYEYQLRKAEARGGKLGEGF